MKKENTIRFTGNNENKKCYISLPISGYDYNERLEYAENVEKKLEEMGYEPVNPFDNGLDNHAPSEQHMKADFKMLLECDYIYLCKDWEKSRGCLAEFNVAANCGIKVLIERNLVDDALKTKAWTRWTDRQPDDNVKFMTIIHKQGSGYSGFDFVGNKQQFFAITKLRKDIDLKSLYWIELPA